MKLKHNKYPYEFAIREDEVIDYIFLFDTRNEKKDIHKFLTKLINDSELTIGDGCEGDITIRKMNIIVDNHWITSIGLHWLTGELNRERLRFPNE